jgi:hypothetical protein
VTFDDARRQALDLASDHVDEIMSRGERCWLDHHGMERGFSSY